MIPRLDSVARVADTPTTTKKYIYDRLADGSLKPEIARTFPFDQTAEAYRYLESNKQIGKIVITL